MFQVRWDDTGKEDTHDWTDLHDWHLLEDELSVTPHLCLGPTKLESPVSFPLKI